MIETQETSWMLGLLKGMVDPGNSVRVTNKSEMGGDAKVIGLMPRNINNKNDLDGRTHQHEIVARIEEIFFGLLCR